MNLRHMQYFIVLAREKNYSKAARELGVTQPTLTQSVQKLEALLGTPLFDRSFAELRLSSAGEIFLAACIRIHDIYHQTVNQIMEVTSGIAGEARIGISPFRAQCMMTEWLGAFQEKYPNVRLQIDELVTEDLFRALKNGEIDLAITAADGKMETDLEYKVIAREEVLIAVPEKMAEGIKGQTLDDPDIICADFSDFKGVSFIVLGENQMLGRHFRMLQKEAGIQCPFTISCTSIETSLTMAAAGYGAAFILSTGLRYYQERYPGLKYFSVTSKLGRREVYAVYRKNQYLSGPAQYLIELLRKKKEEAMISYEG